MSGPLETVNHSKARVRSGRLAGPIPMDHPNRLAIRMDSRYDRVVVTDDPKTHTVLSGQ